MSSRLPPCMCACACMCRNGRLVYSPRLRWISFLTVHKREKKKKRRKEKRLARSIVEPFGPLSRRFWFKERGKWPRAFPRELFGSRPKWTNRDHVFLMAVYHACHAIYIPERGAERNHAPTELLSTLRGSFREWCVYYIRRRCLHGSWNWNGLSPYTCVPPTEERERERGLIEIAETRLRISWNAKPILEARNERIISHGITKAVVSIFENRWKSAFFCRNLFTKIWINLISDDSIDWYLFNSIPVSL